MLRVVLRRKTREVDGPVVVKGFIIEGHAGYDEFGKDVVCAGVSAISQAAGLALKDIFGEKTRYVKRGGFLEVDLADENALQPEARAIMRCVELGVLAIARAYPKNVTVEYTEIAPI